MSKRSCLTLYGKKNIFKARAQIFQENKTHGLETVKKQRKGFYKEETRLDRWSDSPCLKIPSNYISSLIPGPYSETKITDNRGCRTSEKGKVRIVGGGG